jgi:hypothetical protein
MPETARSGSLRAFSLSRVSRSEQLRSRAKVRGRKPGAGQTQCPVFRVIILAGASLVDYHMNCVVVAMFPSTKGRSS